MKNLKKKKNWYWFNLKKVHLINIDINTSNNNDLENNDEPRVETNDYMIEENIDADGDSNSNEKVIYDPAQ